VQTQQRYRAKLKVRFEEMQDSVKALSGQVRELEREKQRRRELEVELLRHRVAAGAGAGEGGAPPHDHSAAQLMRPAAAHAFHPPPISAPAPATADPPNPLHHLASASAAGFGDAGPPSTPAEQLLEALVAMQNTSAAAVAQAQAPPPPPPTLAAPAPAQSTAEEAGQLQHTLGAFYGCLAVFAVTHSLDAASIAGGSHAAACCPVRDAVIAHNPRGQAPSPHTPSS
jgi:hypothetical protein